MTASPQASKYEPHCVTCGFDLRRSGHDGRPWTGVFTAVGLRFACDLHPGSEVRDAVALLERPEALEPAPEECDPVIPDETFTVADDSDGELPVTVVRRESAWGREVLVGRALFGAESGPEKLRQLAAVLEFNAVWLESGRGDPR